MGARGRRDLRRGRGRSGLSRHPRRRGRADRDDRRKPARSRRRRRRTRLLLRRGSRRGRQGRSRHRRPSRSTRSGRWSARTLRASTSRATSTSPSPVTRRRTTAPSCALRPAARPPSGHRPAPLPERHLPGARRALAVRRRVVPARRLAGADHARRLRRRAVAHVRASVDGARWRRVRRGTGRSTRAAIGLIASTARCPRCRIPAVLADDWQGVVLNAPTNVAFVGAEPRSARRRERRRGHARDR